MQNIFQTNDTNIISSAPNFVIIFQVALYYLGLHNRNKFIFHFIRRLEVKVIMDSVKLTITIVSLKCIKSSSVHIL